MKYFLLFLLGISVLACDALSRPIFRNALRFHRSIRFVKGVSWQKIVAGGAAAGTVVAAYKISDGVQDGMVTAAEKEPNTFLATFSSFTSPFKLLGYGISAIILLWISIPLITKLLRKDNNESHDQQK